jgi:inhibitor of Bruton tyrosine kinase
LGPIRVDLKHIESRLFELVAHHIYTDAAEELFDDFTSEDLNDYLALEELLDHIMDIMSIANELMLERLSQICQKLIGRYGTCSFFSLINAYTKSFSVNARNVSSLLNAIAPSSVESFKNVALEYICLSLEAVLQNG